MPQERFENQRRHTLSSFKPQRLRLWLDPPAWSDADGRAANPPEPLHERVPYTWQIEVNAFTDGEGWRYARTFGQGAVWTNSFAAGGNVRRRRYLGRPCCTAATSARADADDVTSASTPPPVSIDLPPARQCAKPNHRHLQEAHGAGNTVAVVTSGGAVEAGEVVGINGASGGGQEVQQHASNGSAAPGAVDATAKLPYQEIYRQYVLRAAFIRHQMEYWMDWYERRKNFLLGATWEASDCALVILSGVLILALLLPTRWLVVAAIYTFFWDGFVVGRLMKNNRHIFIEQLKGAAVSLWLDGEERHAKARQWGPRTLLEEAVDIGVQTLKLCDWIRAEFFEGRPIVTLRRVQSCRTLGDLATIVTTISDKFVKKRSRKRVWYRSTFRNFLDHVPSDVTIFRSASVNYKPTMKN